MTPKEKADELIDKVSEFSDYETMDDKYPQKKLAMIIADEVLEYIGEDGHPPEYKFWQEVKKEIEKL